MMLIFGFMVNWCYRWRFATSVMKCYYIYYSWMLFCNAYICVFSRASHKFHQCFCRCTIWSSFILYLILHFTWPLSSPNKNIVIIISIWCVFLKTIGRFMYHGILTFLGYFHKINVAWYWNVDGYDIKMLLVPSDLIYLNVFLENIARMCRITTSYWNKFMCFSLSQDEDGARE